MASAFPGPFSKQKAILCCPFRPAPVCWAFSTSCFTGNACLVSQKQKRCPLPDDVHSHSAKTGTRHWNSTTCSNQWFCTEPVKLADGSCCNEDDFCYLADSTKVCRSGECVSSNYSLCKGACSVDEDCETNPVPISANVNGVITRFCTYGSCITTIDTAYLYPDPFSALDTSSATNRSIAACLEAECVVTGQVGVDELPFQCTYKWICSKHNPEVVEVVKKRALSRD